MFDFAQEPNPKIERRIRDVVAINSMAARMERGWCQKADAVNEKGYRCGPRHPAAVRWCMNGALLAEQLDSVSHHRLYEMFTEVTGLPMETYNDYPHRTVHDVVAICKMLAGRVEEGYYDDYEQTSSQNPVIVQTVTFTGMTWVVTTHELGEPISYPKTNTNATFAKYRNPTETDWTQLVKTWILPVPAKGILAEPSKVKVPELVT